jgi:hypothetical protein
MSEHHPRKCNSAAKRLLDILRKEGFDEDKSNNNEKADSGYDQTKKEKKSQQLTLFPYMDAESETEE